MPAIDTFHATMAEALAEVTTRKKQPSAKDMVISIDPSRYGGFRVRSTPADLYIDQMTDGPLLLSPGASRNVVGF